MHACIHTHTHIYICIHMHTDTYIPHIGRSPEAGGWAACSTIHGKDT